jgi:hypothetical protein
MPLAYQTAVDTMFGIARTALNSGSAAIVGYVPEVRWQGVEKDEKPPVDKFWLRVTQQTVDEGQSTLRDGTNGKRYTNTGLIFCQLFCPMSDAKCMEKGRALGVLLRNAFTAAQTEIMFTHARINELTPEGKAQRFNVVSDYEYDEIRSV